MNTFVHNLNYESINKKTKIKLLIFNILLGNKMGNFKMNIQMQIHQLLV